MGNNSNKKEMDCFLMYHYIIIWCFKSSGIFGFLSWQKMNKKLYKGKRKKTSKLKLWQAWFFCIAFLLWEISPYMVLQVWILKKSTWKRFCLKKKGKGLVRSDNIITTLLSCSLVFLLTTSGKQISINNA